jgi:hypothetical protein
VPEIVGIPIEAAIVKAGEKIGFLAIGRQEDVALQHLVQPGGRGARRPDRNKVGQPRRAMVIAGTHAALPDLPLSARAIPAGRTVLASRR